VWLNERETVAWGRPLARPWAPPLARPWAPPLRPPPVGRAPLPDPLPPLSLWPPRLVVVVAEPAVPEPVPWARPLFTLAPPTLPSEPAAIRTRSVVRMLWCAVASALLPGLGQAMQRRWLAALLFGVQTVAVALVVARVVSKSKVELLKWTLDTKTLHLLIVGGLAWAAVCALSAADAARTARPAPSSGAAPVPRALLRAAVVLIAVLGLVPGVAVAAVAMRQDALLDTVFAGSNGSVTARPSSLAELGVATTAEAPPAPAPLAVAPASSVPPTAAATTPPATAVPAPTPAPPVPAAPTTGRWTVALLGGDAGPRRWGLRTDTMIVVSVDQATGDTVLISVPRNLQHLPMPRGPLRQRFPDGFTDLANAVYPYVMNHPNLGIDAAAAVKGSLAELLGIPIDNYVLVDMAGFIKIIDALGGVTVDLSKQVPLVPNIDGKTIEAKTVGPGPVHMNGAMALAFSRTREVDSDYARMLRQRCLLAAVAHGISPADLATNYLALASAVEDAFRSDIPRDRLGELVGVFAKMNLDQVRALALIPPVVPSAHPNIAKVRALVSGALEPATAAGEPGVATPSC
jgi:LCP family protein required for cell wall assembly